jgi:transposase
MTRPRLTVVQWATIQEAFPVGTRNGAPPRDRRQIVDGILWILRTGAPWRDLPKEFGPWPTVRDLFDKCTANGNLDRIISILRAARIDSGALDQELWRVDCTVNSAARCAAGGGKKR